MNDEVTIRCPNHKRNLVERLWDYYLAGRGVDFHIPSHGGRSIRVHRLILDLFLSPAKLNQNARNHQQQQQHGRLIEFLLLFLYNGEVTVRRKQLGTLLKVARESDFQMLVDVLESKFHEYSSSNPTLKTKVGHETLQNVEEQIEDHFVEPQNTVLPDTDSSSLPRANSDQQEGDLESMTIKPELADITSSYIGDLDSCHQPDTVHEYIDDHLDNIGYRHIDSPPIVINKEIEDICDERGPDICDERGQEIRRDVSLPLPIIFQKEKQSSSLKEEFDKNIPRSNRELEGPLPDAKGTGDCDAQSVEPRKEDGVSLGVPPTTSSGQEMAELLPEMQDGSGDDVPSVEPMSANLVPQDVPPTTSSYPSSVGSPAPEENPDRFDIQVGKIMVEPDHNADVNKPKRPPYRLGKRAKSDVTKATSTNERAFSCDICKKTFTQQSNLKRHRMLHTGERPYKCQQCPKAFLDRTLLKQHQRTHLGLLPYQYQEADCTATFSCAKALGIHRKVTHLNVPPGHQCHLCERAFYFQADLNQHARIHKSKTIIPRLHDGKKFLDCPTCHKSFLSSRHLRKHLGLRGSEGKTFPCDACRKVFCSGDQLEVHSQTHTEIKPYQCQQCPKRYVHERSLTKHQRTHEGLPSYQCKEAGCSAIYAKSKQLKIHEKSQHLNEPPEHQCPQCSRAFYFQSDLIHHVRVHGIEGDKLRSQLNEGGELLFSCSMCQKTFLRESSLRMHQRLHGSKGKAFHCDTCPKMFCSVHQLEVHSRTHTGIKPYQCPQCHKTFSNPSYMRIHLLSHTGERPFRCDHEGCGMAYPQKQQLRHHKLRHAGIKAFKCPHPNCNKEFYTKSYMKQHIRCHGKNRPYVCELCSMAFFTQTGLSLHVRKIHAAENNEQRKACDTRRVTYDDTLPDSGNSLVLPGSCDQPSDLESITIKSEPADITSSRIGDLDFCHQSNMAHEHIGDHLNNIGNCQINSPTIVIDQEIEDICNERGPETICDTSLPCPIIFQNKKQSSLLKEEFDKNNHRFNRELEGPLPDVEVIGDCGASLVEPRKEEGVPPTTSSGQELAEPLPEMQDGRGDDVLSVGPMSANAMAQDVPPTTSSGSSFHSSSAAGENPEIFDFQVRKIKVEPDHNADIAKSPRRSSRKRKLSNKLSDVTKATHRTSKNGKRPKSNACTECDKTFANQTLLKRHILSVHTSERPFSCDLCRKAFKHQRYLQHHRLLHTGKRPFQCQQCSKGFVDRTGLTNHRRIHRRPLSYQCKETGCSAAFTSRTNLDTHRKAEHPDAPPDLQCHLCERAFYLPHHLDTHLRTHQENKVKRVRKVKKVPIVKMFACDACPKVFSKKRTLVIHSRTHTGIKPYTCTHCEKAFAQKTHLQTHLLTHTKDRPYRCDHDQCGKTFQQSAHLTYHKLSHAGVKAFKCTHPNCNKEYYSLSVLNQHRRRHGKDRPFICEHCGKASYTMGDLNQHVRAMHLDRVDEDRHECDICGETFGDLEKLNLHADSHL